MENTNLINKTTLSIQMEAVSKILFACKIQMANIRDNLEITPGTDPDIREEVKNFDKAKEELSNAFDRFLIGVQIAEQNSKKAG